MSSATMQRVSGRGHSVRLRLTPPAAVLLLVGLSLLGVLVDGLTGTGLRAAFAVCFVLGCLSAAVLIRRRSLRVALVAPPLVYAGVALLSGLAQGDSVPRTVSRQTLALFTQLILGAPVLLTGTVAALVVVLVRLVRGR